jgi:hypothetical protein
LGPRIAPVLLSVCTLAAGCGDTPPRQLDADPAQESSDKPAEAPRGWRTVRNPSAGFSIAIPPGWSARTKRGATLIRSGDELLALTVQADRGPQGRELAPADYAGQTLAAVPGFTPRLRPKRGDTVDSPYVNARADARGVLERSRLEQRVSAVVFQRKGHVSYVAVAFRNAEVRPRGHDDELERVLGTLRAQAPE